MRRTLPLSVLTVAVLTACASTDLKPITKPVNPRVIERELVAPKSVAKRPLSGAGNGGAAKVQPDETDDLPIMPSKSTGTNVAKPSLAGGTVNGKASGLAVAPAAAPGQAAPAAPSQAAPAPAAVAATNAKAAAPEAIAKSTASDIEKASKGQRWQVKASDVRLAATFERWAKESGERGMTYSILWDAGKHVLIEAPTEYRGSFLDAVEQALKSPSIQESDYPLEACEYPNTPPVIRITRWGEQAKDCPDYR